MNKGERAELMFIATLGCFRGKSIKLWANSSQLILISKIETPVNNSTALQIVGQYPSAVTPQSISQMTDAQLMAFCQSVNITKAGRYSKSDVYIDGIGYSIKFMGGSSPTIINHTNRLGWEFAAAQSNVHITHLDNLIDDYWVKRLAGVIKEDVANTDPNSPFANHFSIVEPYLNYFCFDGSGAMRSNHPADKVVELWNACDHTTWNMYDRTNYVSSVWSKLRFSVRSKKGMPTDINAVSALDKASILRWSKNHQNALRGALHVRIK